MPHKGLAGICKYLAPLSSGVPKHYHGVWEYHRFADFLQQVKQILLEVHFIDTEQSIIEMENGSTIYHQQQKRHLCVHIVMKVSREVHITDIVMSTIMMEDGFSMVST